MNFRCTQIETGFNRFGRLPLNQQHTNKGTGPNQDTPGIPTQSSPNLTKKVTNWKTWAYTDGSCKLHQGKQVTGAGVYHPITSAIHYVEPSSAGITNTINRAELAAIAATITHGYTHIATVPLTTFPPSTK